MLGNYDKIQEVQRDMFSEQYTIRFASMPVYFEFVVHFCWVFFDTFCYGTYSKKKHQNTLSCSSTGRAWR